MAADYGQLAENLRWFYDFTGKVVLFVGGGRKATARSLHQSQEADCHDRDVESLIELKTNVATGVRGSVVVVVPTFEEVTWGGDVVYFEFCLHEMADPQKALTHARSLAADIVVLDHLPDSDWVFHVAEEDKVRRSTEAIERFGVRRRATFRGEQRFRNHAELLTEVTVQGAIALERAQRFAGALNIVIPMTYELALL